MVKSDTRKTKAWEIKYTIWGKKEYNESIALVIDQIADEISMLIPGGPPLGFKPVILVNALYYDHRLYWPLNQEYYKIGLDVGHITFGKTTYQFTHELAHIYCDPRVVNWFIEIICHVASFYFLDFLSEKWENQPHDSDYYKNFDVFNNFKNEVLREAVDKVDLYQFQVSGDWLKKELRKIHNERTLGNRIIYNIISMEILPLFKEFKEGWQILPYIGSSSVPLPPENPENLTTNREVLPDFDKLYQIIPEHLKPFVKKLLEKIWY